MKPAFFLKLAIPTMVILGFLFTINPSISMAQTNQQLPKVSLEMFIVPQKEVCPPHGYIGYDSNQASNCPTLTRKDIDEWRECVTIQPGIIKVPPGEISLGQHLFTTLDAYSRKDQSTKPLSFVLVFEWDQPQNSPISLERKKGPDFPSMKWPGVLENHKMWIHHERADAFLPANNIKWTLREGSNEWVFKAER